MSAAEKVPFALDMDDGWPPVSVEHVWCERTGNRYTLQNAPFFISGLAFGDVFVAERDPVNDCIFEFQVIQPSGRSLVWVLNKDNLDFTEAKRKFTGMGCRLEGFPQFSLYSIDIPADIETAEINAAVDSLEDEGFALAFPVWRHEAIS